MGGKRKPQSMTQKQIKPSLPISNKIRTLKTFDGGMFMISDSLLSKFSFKLRRKIQQIKSDDVINLDEDISKSQFKYLEEFMNNHKDKQGPLAQIYTPIKSNVSLRNILEETDAILLEKIDQEGGFELISKLLDISTDLQMEDFRKRLFCLVAIKLCIYTVDDLIETYKIPTNIEVNEDFLKQETRTHLEQLKKNFVDKKMDEQ